MSVIRFFERLSAHEVLLLGMAILGLVILWHHRHITWHVQGTEPQ